MAGAPVGNTNSSKNNSPHTQGNTDRFFHGFDAFFWGYGRLTSARRGDRDNFGAVAWTAEILINSLNVLQKIADRLGIADQINRESDF